MYRSGEEKMKLAMIDDMELGNMIFGNSRGVYHVEPREEYQDAFCDFLDEIGCDCYGWNHHIAGNKTETDKFIVRPYYWGDDEAKAELPNFVYKPTGLEIRWYKYPMRDAYSNQDVSVEDFKEILKECEKSMNNDGKV